jgi:glycosyltransferase involved in cell wall biosynthesis
MTVAPDKPGLAILCGELPPYRIHFHQRIARELTEYQLWTVLFRDSAWSAWKIEAPHEINTVRLAEGHLKKYGGRGGGLRSQLERGTAAIKFLSAHNIRAVLVNGYDEIPQLRAIRWCNARHIPVLLWADSNIRSDHVAGLKRSVKRSIVPQVLRRCTALLACGSLGRDYFIRYGADRNKIFYSPVEPDYAPLESLDPAVIGSVMGRFGLPPDRLRFVVSSRLVQHKRVDLAIDAFAGLAVDYPIWDLVILGDGPLMNELKARVPEHLQSRVIFTGFVGDQSTVTAVYRASHVLVHPASYEPWALVINEAAAAGLAIISSDVVGAAAELVRDGINGCLVPSNNLETLTRAMRETADPARLPALRAASRLVLAEWRKAADPVGGLRQALAYSKSRLTSP